MASRRQTRNPIGVTVVLWRDHHSDSGWVPIDQESTAPVLAMTIGVVVAETPASIVLAHGWTGAGRDRSWAGTSTILREAIVGLWPVGRIPAVVLRTMRDVEN